MDLKITRLSLIIATLIFPAFLCCGIEEEVDIALLYCSQIGDFDAILQSAIEDNDHRTAKLEISEIYYNSAKKAYKDKLKEIADDLSIMEPQRLIRFCKQANFEGNPMDSAASYYNSYCLELEIINNCLLKDESKDLNFCFLCKTLTMGLGHAEKNYYNADFDEKLNALDECHTSLLAVIEILEKVLDGATFEELDEIATLMTSTENTDTEDISNEDIEALINEIIPIISEEFEEDATLMKEAEIEQDALIKEFDSEIMGEDFDLKEEIEKD